MTCFVAEPGLQPRSLVLGPRGLGTSLCKARSSALARSRDTSARTSSRALPHPWGVAAPGPSPGRGSGASWDALGQEASRREGLGAEGGVSPKPL